jgi:hypothetical protein
LLDNENGSLSGAVADNSLTTGLGH